MAEFRSRPGEFWRPVVGFEGAYSVSNLGGVRRDACGNGTQPGTLLAWKTSVAYPFVKLSYVGKSRRAYVHVLVAEAFLGPKPEDRCVNHIDGDRMNPIVTNLEYVTASENTRHAYDNGLIGQKRGVDHPLAKLTDTQITEILAKYVPRKYGTPRLAAEYGVSSSTIQNVIKRFTKQGATPAPLQENKP